MFATVSDLSNYSNKHLPNLNSVNFPGVYVLAYLSAISMSNFLMFPKCTSFFFANAVSYTYKTFMKLTPVHRTP
jgi:hypothetical protein